MPKQVTCSRLSNQRWGIFCENRLMATIGSQKEAKLIVRYLKNRLKDVVDTPPVAVSSQVSFKPGDRALITEGLLENQIS